MQNNTESLFIKCNCYGHTLEIERDNDYGGDDNGFNFTIWQLGRENTTLSFKEKIRWCWHIIKTGNPWADGIMSTNKQAQEIVKFINQNLPSEDKINKTQ